MRTIDDMISQEVLVCVSSLVSTLAQGYGHSRDSCDLSDLTEQAFELASPVLDYEEAAREAGWTNPCEGETFRNKHTGERCTTARDWRQLCEFYDIEPHEREVYEHHAVTDWLAERLEAAGEKVDRDFAGMCVWARTTSGQMIAADSVIERIYAETHRAEG